MTGDEFKQEAVIELAVEFRSQHPEWTSEEVARHALADAKKLYDVVQSEFNF